MNQTDRDIPTPTDDFIQNRNNFPPEELFKYAGRYVAWSLDGRQIVGSGSSYEDLGNNLRAAGIDPSRVVHSYVGEPDVANL